MKHYISLSLGVLAAVSISMSSCTDLDEKVFDRVDANAYYQNETSVQAAIAPIYASIRTGNNYEKNNFLQELSADQMAWRTWNGGAWGWDEAEKFVLSSQTWNSESVIIKQAWEAAWTTIGLCNLLIHDLNGINAESIGMTEEAKQMYIAEVRSMRAWAYYKNFELWGGALPLNTDIPSGNDIPGSADPDFDTGCKKIFEFISTELDESLPFLMKEDGSRATMIRMNQAANRMIKMRLLLNSEVFIKEAKYTDAAAIAQKLIDGEWGQYKLAADYRDVFGYDNYNCPEIIFAYACEVGQLEFSNMRNFPMLAYNWGEYFGGTSDGEGAAWNCTILTPSHDNSGTVLPTGGTDTGGKSFIYGYGDKLGGIYDRMSDLDVRKQPYVWDLASNNYRGMFLMGEMKANFGTGEPMKGDADRDGEPLVYVDQLGTFKNLGRDLEVVMSPRWGETNSGYRLIKYPIAPVSTGLNFRNIGEVEFRIAEAYYTLAECKMRSGDADGAKDLVNQVRGRYFANPSVLDTEPVPGAPAGFWKYDLDWMLSEWGVEFINEGYRRRTDLRRFDKFTQGQWWFFGRANESDFDLPAKRDRKYEWYPLPQAALMVNPGLVQTPGY